MFHVISIVVQAKGFSISNPLDHHVIVEGMWRASISKMTTFIIDSVGKIVTQTH
jgi:hypothetical protein